MLHQRSPVKTGCITVGHITAIAHNSDFFGYFQNFIQFMTDKQDGNALPLQRLDDIKKRPDFLFRKGGGRFIHDDQPGALADRPTDGDNLFIRHREIFHIGPQIQVNPDFSDRFPRYTIYITPVH